MEENINNQQPEQNQLARENKPISGMTIVAINLIILAVYTILFKLAGDGGFVLDALILVLHVTTCIIMSIVKKSGFWLLSAFLVLAIGFSTCVYVLPMRFN